MKENLCPRCGKDMSEDYYLLCLHRIKDGVPLFAGPIKMCDECYAKLVKAQDILIDKSIE